MGVILLLVVLYPTVDQSLGFGMGPDVPVYLWWGRAAAELGVDVVPDRPGIGALLPTLGGTLGAGDVEVQAGLQYILVVVIGLAGAGLASGFLPRLLAGVLTGLFATFLAAGYVSNLVMAAAYLAALGALVGAAELPGRRRRGLAASALLLAAGGLAHPQFLLIGVVILCFGAAWAWLAGRNEDARHVLLAALGGGLLTAAGLALARYGGPAIVADTSKDALLRRLGLEAELRQLYLERFAQNWRRYAPWALLPAAVAGATRDLGTTRELGDAQDTGDVRRWRLTPRILAAWLAATIAGVVLAVLTGWFPPDRVITFAFCLPILAALGLERLAGAARMRALARVAAVAGVVAIVWPTLGAWLDERVFVKDEQVEQLVAAGRVADTTPPGTPLVFVVNDEDAPQLFNLTFSENLARAAVPAARAPDVEVRTAVGGELPPGTALFVLPTLAPGVATSSLHEWPGEVFTSVQGSRRLPPGSDEIGPSSPEAIVATTIGLLVLFAVVGHGWARWVLGPTSATRASITAASVTAPAVWAMTPAFGAGALVLASFAVDRVGIGLGGRLGPLLASALAGAGGYMLAFRDRRGGGIREREPVTNELP